MGSPESQTAPGVTSPEETKETKAGARPLSPVSERVVTYLPDNSVQQGYGSLVREIIEELRRSRFLTYQLFKRDFIAGYKQSLLGIVWILFVPMITLGTFVVLRKSGVVAVGTSSTPYALFAGLGIAIWSIFSGGVMAGAGALTGGGDLIARINFSKKALVFSSVGRVLMGAGILFVMVVLLLVVYVIAGYAYQPTAWLLLFPISLLPLLLFTVGMGFVLALLNGIIRDIGNVLGTVITFLMLLTPVLYERPPKAMGSLSWIIDYNPLYYLVTTPRDLILRGEFLHTSGFLICTGLAIVSFFLGLFIFHLTEARIAERI